MSVTEGDAGLDGHRIPAAIAGANERMAIGAVTVQELRFCTDATPRRIWDTYETQPWEDQPLGSVEGSVGRR